jgi:hypothetical protein
MNDFEQENHLLREALQMILDNDNWWTYADDDLNSFLCLFCEQTGHTNPHHIHHNYDCPIQRAINLVES